MNPKNKLLEKIRTIEYDYTLDKVELGKIMIIASATLLLFSVQGIIQMDQSANKLDKFDRDMDRLETVTSTNEFNQSLEALQGLRGTRVGQQFQYAIYSFRQLQSNVQDFKAAKSQVQNLKETYQWYVLFSVMGIAAGITTIYV